MFGSDQIGYLENIFASAVSIILAVTVLDIRADRRSRLDREYETKQAKERAEHEFKERLILQMGSPDNGFAIEAVRLLGKKGWLEDGSLINANLQGANLEGANLANTNLQKTILTRANLQKAFLWHTNLHEASLLGANLDEAQFEANNLSYYYSRQTLFFAEIVAGIPDIYTATILPDGSHWTPGRDLREFTHPDEWRAEQAAKPPT